MLSYLAILYVFCSCKVASDLENVSEYIKDIDKLVNEYETERNLDQMESSSFKTSTPKKKRDALGGV